MTRTIGEVTLDDDDTPPTSIGIPREKTAWHWFDRVKAGQEVLRLLRPGGRLVISVLEWHGLPGNVLDRTSQLIRQYRPANAISNSSVLRYPDWTTELVQAGYTDWDLSSYVTSITYSHDQWRGRVRASQAVGPSMDAETVQRFDNEVEKMLRQEFPTNPMAVPHRISTLIALASTVIRRLALVSNSNSTTSGGSTRAMSASRAGVPPWTFRCRLAPRSR